MHDCVLCFMFMMGSNISVVHSVNRRPGGNWTGASGDYVYNGYACDPGGYIISPMHLSCVVIVLA